MADPAMGPGQLFIPLGGGNVKLKITAAAQTHVGKVRANNEDNFYLCGHIRTDVSQKEAEDRCTVRDSRFLAAVADGMGGEELGELASLLAVQSLRPCGFDAVRDTALASIRQANSQICAEMGKNGGRRVGSTLAALYIDDGKALCCNIGDSRCYLLRDGALKQLSTDHNKARRMVELGVLTPEQAARHPSRHELTQHLGIFESEMVIEPTFSEAVALRPGDAFLLCCDGLTDMVTEADIAARLTAGGTPEEQAADLIQMALAHGGRDNVTALVICVSEDDRSLWRRALSGLRAHSD